LENVKKVLLTTKLATHNDLLWDSSRSWRVPPKVPRTKGMTVARQTYPTKMPLRKLTSPSPSGKSLFFFRIMSGHHFFSS
jgi:hypothetical protein